LTTEEYLHRVWSALSDLPWKTKRELLSELRAHLSELPDGTDLRTRLGTPEDYAAELRGAAGLERRRGMIPFLRARRPRNIALTVVALVLLGLVLGSFAWVQSYQPLDWAGGGIRPLNLKFTQNGTAEPIEFHKGGHFRLGVPISNNGSFGVRIVGLGALKAGPIAFLPHPPLPFSIRLLMTRPSKNWDDRGLPLIPSQPFELEPGEESMLVLEGTYTKTCRPWQPGDVATPEPRGYLFKDGFIPIRFHFLWKTSTALVFPSFLLEIRFPKGCR
jgi:hypothetical protein